LIQYGQRPANTGIFLIQLRQYLDISTLFQRRETIPYSTSALRAGLRVPGMLPSIDRIAAMFTHPARSFLDWWQGQWAQPADIRPSLALFHFQIVFVRSHMSSPSSLFFTM
jgi:hypothetical protein